MTNWPGLPWFFFALGEPYGRPHLLDLYALCAVDRDVAGYLLPARAARVSFELNVFACRRKRKVDPFRRPASTS
jgi:hypothetical protein